MYGPDLMGQNNSTAPTLSFFSPDDNKKEIARMRAQAAETNSYYHCSGCQIKQTINKIGLDCDERMLL